MNVDSSLCALGDHRALVSLPRHADRLVTFRNASHPWSAAFCDPSESHHAKQLISRETHAPLVSALCVSHHRSAKLQRSIALWWAQSYPSLELVLAIDEDDLETKAIAFSAHQLSHRLGLLTTQGPTTRQVLLHFVTNQSIALGALRTLVVSIATGQYVIQVHAHAIAPCVHGRYIVLLKMLYLTSQAHLRAVGRR